MAKRQIIVGTHGTELERKCGIATFGYNLSKNFNGLEHYAGLRINSIIKEEQTYRNDRIIWRETNQDFPNIDKLISEVVADRNLFRKTGLYDRAEIINLEYGIWEDKNQRDFLVPFIKGLYNNRITNIVIPHTVLKDPENYNDSNNKINPRKGEQYERVMKEVLKYTDQVICLTPSVIDILIERYDAPRELLNHVDHGVNDIVIPNRQELRNEFGTNGRDIFVSGGFFSRGKDVFTVLSALAKSKAKGKNNLWINTGITHKDVLRYEGESFRNECSDFAKKLGLRPLMVGNGEENKNGLLRQLKQYNLNNYDVVFLNAFLNDKESLESKVMATACIIPNKGTSQISSGEIARAIEANRTYLATESPYSLDMAKQGIGFTYKLENSDSLEKGMDFLIRGVENKGANLHNLEMTSAIKKAKMLWPDKSKEIFQILKAIVHKKEEDYEEKRTLSN